MKNNLQLVLIFLLLSCTSPPEIKKWEIPKQKDFEQMRIRLDLSSTEVEVGANSKIVILSNGQKIQEVERLFQSSAENLKLNERLRLQFTDKQFIYKSKIYRGELELYRRPIGVQVVNILPLELYLLSVVPSEMPAFWPKEALKAQAVAARTYAVGNVLSSKFDDYHLESDVKSQMYTGISRETKFSSQAVQDTKGEILVSNNQIVQAYYHSNSGGITETPDMVWGSKLDYLVSVKSDFCKKADTYEWKAVLDKKFIEKKLESLGLGEIQEISIKEFTPTGRVKTLEIKGTESTREIKGQDFRMNLSPMKIRSLLFTIKKENDQFLLEGNGFGHGVGMSQWGALNMARANHEYKEILYYYYKNVELVALPN